MMISATCKHGVVYAGSRAAVPVETLYLSEVRDYVYDAIGTLEWITDCLSAGSTLALVEDTTLELRCCPECRAEAKHD